ncbi:MAG: NADP-dependent isocitrate dehydrogenase [Coriobacteriales bacterium]|nr:NADP-dependent isocitrate dehydrogenase [Coriobacteriales bacterium]
MTDRISMQMPLVEMDGDEMTRVIWSWVKEILLIPYVDLQTEYFDLSLTERERTNDAITIEAAEATKRLGVAVKCATITPNQERLEEYNLSRLYPSPNATIRAILDGTVFRAPIQAVGIVPYLPHWVQPITIARHAYGDVYKAVELSCADQWAGARVELLATNSTGQTESLLVYDFGKTGAKQQSGDPKTSGQPSSQATGIIQAMHNTDASISSFARSCFTYALSTGQDLWFSTKDTISKIYDRHFREVFEEIYEQDFRDAFSAANISYSYTLVDDAVARVIRSNGGFIWACKNYDGDVMSDMIATAFGSLAMMSSVLVSPDGCFEYEAAHGTVQRHYYKYQAGEETSTNPVATIFAWSGALRKRGELDGLPELETFADNLEKATLEVIATGIMTGDLYDLSQLEGKQKVNTRAFLEAIAVKLDQAKG